MNPALLLPLKANAHAVAAIAAKNPALARRLFPALDVLARRQRNLEGLGDCPAFAPYATAGGGCSNVPAEIDANAYFQSGGVLADNGTIVGWPGGDEPTLDCPAGSQLNPFTGRVECVNPTATNLLTASGYVPRASNDRSVMDQIAAAAVAEGRARGFNISCASVPIGGDPITNEQRYAAECTVNGSPGHDASVLLTPGGNWETLATEVGASPFFQASSGYSYVPPTSQQSVYQQIAQSAVKAATGSAAPAPAVTYSSGVRQPASGGAAPAAPAQQAPAGPADGGAAQGAGLTEQIQAAIGSGSVPSWAYLAGAAVVAFLLLGGRR